MFVAWDTYERGNYDVRLRSTAEGAKAVEIASSNRFEARPSLACDAAGRVWIAYEEGDENWGKDYSNATPERIPVRQGGFPLYLERTIRVKCLDTDGTLKQAPGSLENALPAGPRRGKSCPRLARRCVGRRLAACSAVIRCPAAAARSGTASPLITTAMRGRPPGTWRSRRT